MANSTIKFPQEMPPAATINGSDKIMIADAVTNEAKSASFDSAKQYLNITGIELKPVPAGALPAGPADQERKMQITEAGTWTYGGSSFVNPDGSVMILWWNMSTWSIADQYALPMQDGVDTIVPTGNALPKEKAVASYVSPLFSITEEGKNIIDSESFVGGTWQKESGNNNINFSFSENWVSVAVTRGFTIGETYFYQGYTTNISDTLHIVVCADSNNQSTGTFFKPDIASGFIIPAGTTTIYLRVANATGAGLNPQSSPTVGTAMLAKGSAASSFTPFSFGVNALKIIGVQPELQANIDSVNGLSEELNSVTISPNQLIDNSQMRGGAYANTGIYAASDNWICTSIIDIRQGNEYVTISGYGTVPITRARILFFDAAGVFISAVMSPSAGGAGSVTAAIPSNAKKIAFNIANVVGIGVNPTTSPYAQTVIAVYGELPKPYEPFSDGIYLDGSKIKNLDIPNGNPICFYTYNPTGAAGYPRFTVFTKFKGSGNTYNGFFVDLFYNMSELVYSNQYRITGAKVFKYDGINMIDQGVESLIVGESECVYMCVGRADHTGGVHGDEIFQEVYFYADGVQIPTDAIIGLTPCADAYYIQKSTTHESAAAGGIVNPEHPVEAIHYKQTLFFDGGYETRNRLVWQAANIPVAYWYAGISCIGKPFGKFVENELLERIVVNGDNTEKLNRQGLREIRQNNPDTGLSSRATSVTLKPFLSVTGSNLVNPDALCRVFFWDRPGDNKYYRRYNPTVSPAIGDIYESTTHVMFDVVNDF